MGRFALLTIALAGCLDNPTVDVDQQSLDMPQGTAQAVTVSVDGEPVDSLFSVVWTIDDPTIATTTPRGRNASKQSARHSASSPSTVSSKSGASAG